MLARVFSCAVIGLDGVIVDVEVDIARGQSPTTTVVGLPDAAVQESRERVRAAIRNSALTWPFNSRITISLAPGDLRKEGPAYDVPIAVGILAASGQVVADLTDAIFVGELALTGDVRPVRGVLPMVAVARNHGMRRAFVPAANAAEAALVEGMEVFALESLSALAAALLGGPALPRAEAPVADPSTIPSSPGPDLADVIGQEHARRALEIAAAGGHNLVMRGPPGSGKTLLARCIPSILPPLTPEEALEVTRIYSVAGLLPPGEGLVRTRPFRAPHHTISNAGLVGGGSVPRPGEITLAHRGVLFLDELPEFAPRVLEVMRQPLEDRVVNISRARTAVTFPATFSLIAALNPCLCGFWGDPERACTCPPNVVARYQQRVSGPLLDRIDLFIDVPRVDYEKLTRQPASTEHSAAVRERVVAARRLQAARFAQPAQLNGDMSVVDVRSHAQAMLTSTAEQLLGLAARRLTLSARSFHRILKVSRTIADLEGRDLIEERDAAEALQYRQRVD